MVPATIPATIATVAATQTVNLSVIMVTVVYVIDDQLTEHY